MEYIIDGLNVIKTSFIKKYEVVSFERGRDFLIDIVERYKRKHPKVDFTIVFDGYCREAHFYSGKRIKIIFSNEETADVKIRKLLEKKKNRREVFVVSDDREIREFSKILGANPLKVFEFLDIIYPKKEIKIEKEKEIDYKLKSLIEKELENFYGEKIEKNRKENMEFFGKGR